MVKAQEIAPEEKYHKKITKVLDEHLDSGQQVDYALSRAQEEAEKVIKGKYHKVPTDSKLREDYITTFRKKLIEEISKRFPMYKVDMKKDSDTIENFLANLGVPKAHELDEILRTMDRYNPNLAKGELSQYQGQFLQTHLRSVPSKYGRSPEDKEKLLKATGHDDIIDATFATEEDILRAVISHAQGSVASKGQISAGARKRKKQKD